MSLYSDIVAGVITWTNRPTMTAEIDLAIRSALKSAHRSGRYWRDLVTVPLTNQPTDAVQQIDLSAVAPRFSQLQSIGPTGSNIIYEPVTVGDQLDDYKTFKTNICYGFGTYLMIRANAPVSELTLNYYRLPNMSPLSAIDSWIADLHQDLIILSAASTVLALIGEQEIKSKVDMLAFGLKAELLSESLEIIGR